MDIIKDRKFDWGKKGLISSSWLWGYNVSCIDPAEQTAAAWLHSNTQQNISVNVKC